MLDFLGKNESDVAGFDIIKEPADLGLIVMHCGFAVSCTFLGLDPVDDARIEASFLLDPTLVMVVCVFARNGSLFAGPTFSLSFPRFVHFFRLDCFLNIFLRRAASISVFCFFTSTTRASSDERFAVENSEVSANFVAVGPVGGFSS